MWIMKIFGQESFHAISVNCYYSAVYTVECDILQYLFKQKTHL